MNQIREFLVKIPFLCGAKNAERISWIFGAVFDNELTDTSPFHRNEEDKKDILNRSKVLFDLLYCDSKADIKKVNHCIKIVSLLETNHYMKSHKENELEKKVSSLYESAKKSEKRYSEITDVMSASKAKSIDSWNFA